MTRQTDLFPHVMDLKAGMARVETTLLTLADLPSRVATLEQKMLTYEQRALGGKWVAAKFWAIVTGIAGLVGGVASFWPTIREFLHR